MALAFAPPAAAQTVWELTPYRIQLLAGFAPAPELTPQLQADLLGELTERTDAVVGAPWDVTLLPLVPGERPTLPADATEPAHKGREIFFSRQTGCARCHRPPLYSDGGWPDAEGRFALRDVGTRLPEAAEQLRLDTPSLLGLGSLAAYLHHRQAKTLEQVFTDFNPQDKHGRTSHLSDDEILALVEFLQYLQPPDFDKVMVLAFSPAAGGYRVTARELDLRTRLWGPPVSRQVWQLAKLRDAALGAMLEAFAPLARVESVKQKQVVLRLKAAALPPRDKGLTLVGPGDVFRPVIRYNDGEGNPRQIAPVPWTFCTVEKISGEKTGRRELHCRLHTGYRSPLSGRRRGRVEQLALAVVPPQRPSTLVLKSRSEPRQLLAGYDVYAHPPDSRVVGQAAHDVRVVAAPSGDAEVLQVLAKPVERLQRGSRTDRQGRLTVPPVENPLRVLLVRNGGEPLARLPMVPGLQPELIAEIANDDQRLEAEGFLTGLQEELVDLVTRREVLFALTRARIEAGQLDKAGELIDELRRLDKSQSDLAKVLAQQQRKARSDDPVVQAKIEKLFGDTQKLLDTYVDPEDTEELRRELRKAKQSGAGS